MTKGFAQQMTVALRSHLADVSVAMVNDELGVSYYARWRRSLEGLLAMLELQRDICTDCPFQGPEPPAPPIHGGNGGTHW